MCDNPTVKIAAVVGAASVLLAVVIGYFSSENMWVAAPAVGALAMMGVLLGLFGKGKSE